MISARVRAVTAYSYSAFPVPAGAVDLRGDGSPPLAALGAALRQAIGGSTNATLGYGDVSGNATLRAALGEVFGLSGERVVVTNGASEALHLALLCTSDHADTVLLPRPAFPGFDELAGLAGLRTVHYAVPGPIPDAPAAAATVVCTPHNPTGVLTHRHQLRGGVGGWIIWDACHMPLTGPHVLGLGAGLTASDIVIFSVSKLLRMPGVRVGCLISPNPDIIHAATAAKTHLSMSCGQLGQRLAAAVLADSTTRAEIAARHARLDSVRARVAAALTTSGVFTVDPAEAGTHLFVRAADGRADAWRLLAETGVIGLPGTVFNAPACTVRLCVSQPEAVIEAALDCLGAS